MVFDNSSLFSCWFAIVQISTCCKSCHLQCLQLPAIARAYFKKVDRVPKYDSDTRLTAKDATDTKTQAISTSPGPECNGRRPGPGFGPKSGNYIFDFTLLTRAIPGIRRCYYVGLQLYRFRHVAMLSLVFDFGKAHILNMVWRCRHIYIYIYIHHS